MTDAPLRIWAETWSGRDEDETYGFWNVLGKEVAPDAHEYHLHTREALAQSPIVQAMIAEAVERAADMAASAIMVPQIGTPAQIVREAALATIRRRG
jgi:hypothetical protein